jgi:DNA-binding CsgD family transcriptional regulator
MSELRRAVAHVDSAETSKLTHREAEIVELVAAGLTNALIAERLWISPGTVKKHLENIYAKLGVPNRTAVATKITARYRNRSRQ